MSGRGYSNSTLPRARTSYRVVVKNKNVANGLEDDEDATATDVSAVKDASAKKGDNYLT